MSGIYHEWNGTTLTITSDSGTSSADLKGDDGCRGVQGAPGILLVDSKPLVGRATEAGGEIYNDYENNQALAPFTRAEGFNNRAGINGYKLLAVNNTDGVYTLTVKDAHLKEAEQRAIDKYGATNLLCFDGQGHYYNRIRVKSIATNDDGNSVITLYQVPEDVVEDGKLALDTTTNEWENWIYCLDKPNAGEPVLAARGASVGGANNNAIGYGAFAFGMDNQAIGKASFAAGRGNTVYYAGYATGYKNTVTGENASAYGSSNTASGNSAHAEGTKTIASGNYSHSEGSQTTASGLKSHAEGDRTTASGAYAHAEGASTTASGEKSHAEGSVTTASALNAHAEGRLTTASGAQAHAEGDNTIASGKNSHAEGEYTIASGINQHVQGKWNVENKTLAHIVGGGTSDEERKNIYELDWNGNATFAGSVNANEISVKGKKVNPLDITETLNTGIFYRGIGSPDYIEYLNPYTASNQEYRTFEKLKSKPVYVKHLFLSAANIGSLGSTTKFTFTHDIGIKELVRYDAKLGSNKPLPIICGNGGFIGVDTIDENSLTVIVDNFVCNNLNLSITLYYTKS